MSTVIISFRKGLLSLRTYSKFHVFFLNLDISFSDISKQLGSAILRDCSDPDVFRPQRYIDDDSLPDPFEVIFGFGRR